MSDHSQRAHAATDAPVPATPDAERSPHAAVGELCDYCGAEALAWRKCKLICSSCQMINKSCADL